MVLRNAQQAQFFQPANLLPEEIVHIMQRKHWFVLVGPLALVLAFALLASAITITLIPLIQISLATAMLFLLFISLITFGLITKIIIDWLFNFYIITTHKISETRINPLFADSISEILLKQVRCTEIDVVNYGIVNQILNKGNVHITFDRPTHKEEFILSDISNPREIGAHLSNVLIAPQTGVTGLWFKDRPNPNVFRYTDEIEQIVKGGGDI